MAVRHMQIVPPAACKPDNIKVTKSEDKIIHPPSFTALLTQMEITLATLSVGKGKQTDEWFIVTGRRLLKGKVVKREKGL